ncbi:MAG: hypothetical protein IJZ89_07390 [Clostridia bacterium]|nr:hypothetical protein [Clostridia bacterium]
MTIKRSFLFLILFLFAFSLIACENTGGERVGIYLNINAPKINSIEIDFWCGDVLRNTAGVSNADNSEMKPGQAFGFDIPETGTLDFTCDITLKTVDGKEINSEKTKVTLPAGHEKYDLEVSLDENGEYSIYILSKAKEDKSE